MHSKYHITWQQDAKNFVLPPVSFLQYLQGFLVINMSLQDSVNMESEISEIEQSTIHTADCNHAACRI